MEGKPKRTYSQRPPSGPQSTTTQNSEGSQNERGHLDNTECIFIRGVYVNDRTWRSVGYDDLGKYSPEEDGAEAVLDNEDVTVQSMLPETQVSPLTIGYLSDGDLVTEGDLYQCSPRSHVGGSYRNISGIG